MSEPIYSEATEHFYATRLPGVYRREDAEQSWHMKSYIASIVDYAQDVRDLIERFRYTPPDDPSDTTKETSDLVNPQTADAAWLPWLAQLVGVTLRQGWSDQQKRDAIQTATSGTQAGTRASIANAAKAALTGTQTVFVHPFSNSSGGIGAGGQWDVLILTLAAETVGDVVQTVIDAGAKPAGIKLWATTAGATWTTVETTYPTWADWEAHTWGEIEQTGA